MHIVYVNVVSPRCIYIRRQKPDFLAAYLTFFSKVTYIAFVAQLEALQVI